MTAYEGSGNELTGTCQGTTCPELGLAGVAYTAADFDGVDDVITVAPVKRVVNRYTYDFESGDRRVDYALQKGMKVRGHPLLFGTVDPDWVFMDGEEEVSREVLIERMEEHIRTIVSRYKGKIHYFGADIKSNFVI